MLLPFSGLILGLHPANERRRYKVTPYLIDWAQTRISPAFYEKTYVYCHLLYRPFHVIIALFISNCVKVYNGLKRAAHSKVYKRTDMPEHHQYKGHRRPAPIILVAELGWTLGSVRTWHPFGINIETEMASFWWFFIDGCRIDHSRWRQWWK